LRNLYPEERPFKDAIREYINQVYPFTSGSDFEKKRESLSHLIFDIMDNLVLSVEIIDSTKPADLFRVWFPVLPMSLYLE